MSSNEYLTSLRETHTANGIDKETIQVCDVVIYDDALRNKWRLGSYCKRITKRTGWLSANIQATTDAISRLIMKLYRLEVHVESGNSKNYQSNKPQINENIQEFHPLECQTSTCPHRTAASKARSLVNLI